MSTDNNTDKDNIQDKDNNKEIGKTKNPDKKKKLNIRQKEFVKAYTNKESKETYGNITRSYMTAYNNENYNYCHTSGSRLMQNGTVKTEIEAIMEEKGIGVDDRIGILQTIASGRGTRRTTIYRKRKGKEKPPTKCMKKDTHCDGGQQNNNSDCMINHTLDGLEVEQVIECTPTHSEQVKAIDVLNKLSGVYNKNRALEQLAIDEFRTIRKQILKEMYNKSDSKKSKKVDKGTGGMD